LLVLAGAPGGIEDELMDSLLNLHG